MDVCKPGSARADYGTQSRSPRKLLASPRPFNRSDHVIKINQMSSFYDKPGEFGYAIHGEEYGFDGLSFVLTETSRTVGRRCIPIRSKRHTSC
jgi:hypothetical protein